MATRLYTPTEYAELMGISPQYVRLCCRRGSIKAFMFETDGGKRCKYRIPFDLETVKVMAAQNAAAWPSATADAEI